MLATWDHGSSLIFVPNPYYVQNQNLRGQKKSRYVAKLKKIVWLVIPDVTTLSNELRTHDIDVYADVDENSIARLSDISGITARQKLIGNWRRLMFNTSKPLLHDRRVRLAIAEAIDWNRINATVYHGYNRPAVSDIYPESWAAPAIPRYPYDPKNAARLLRAAGWELPAASSERNDGFAVRERNGVPLHLQLSTGTNKLENAQAEVVIQQMLRQVGIEVEIRNYPVSLLFAQDGPLYSGRYDMEWSVDTNGPDPDNSGSWNGAFVPPRGANTAWINDPQINRLSDAAVRTYDIGQRRKLYQKEEERLHELVPMVPFYWENAYFAMNSDVKNYKPAAFITDSWNAWEWSI
jgi:peptide/nickel transport system substrate-binding protein